MVRPLPSDGNSLKFRRKIERGRGLEALQTVQSLGVKLLKDLKLPPLCTDAYLPGGQAGIRIHDLIIPTTML